MRSRSTRDGHAVHPGCLRGSEEELKSELDHSGVGSRISTGHLPERGRSDARVRRCKLGAVKYVKELGAEFEPEFLVRSKSGALEQSEIKVVHPRTSQRRIGPGFIAEYKVRRRRKASGIKPFVQLCPQAPLATEAFVATRNHVRSRAAAEQCRVVGRAVAEYQREAFLEDRYAVHSPTTYKLVHECAGVGQVFLAMPEGKIQNVTDHHSLGYVLRRQRALSSQIRVVLDAAGCHLQPVRQRIGITDELGVGVGHQERSCTGEAPLHSQLQRIITTVVVALTRQSQARVLRIGAVELSSRSSRTRQSVGGPGRRIVERIGHGLEQGHGRSSGDGWAPGAPRGKRRAVRSVVGADE